MWIFVLLIVLIIFAIWFFARPQKKVRLDKLRIHAVNMGNSNSVLTVIVDNKTIVHSKNPTTDGTMMKRKVGRVNNITIKKVGESCIIISSVELRGKNILTQFKTPSGDQFDGTMQEEGDYVFIAA